MTWFDKIETTLYITFGLLLLVVVYRAVINHWKRDMVMRKVILKDIESPRNASGIISFAFEVKEASVITFRLLDVKEVEVKKLLLNEAFDSGEHSIQFDSSEISSGWYWYELVSADQRIIKKFKIA